MGSITTLCFILSGNKVLLVKRKRGFKSGIWNAPGGKVELGESIEEAAVREVMEETGLAVGGIRKAGVLDFFFGKRHFTTVHVFLAEDFQGDAAETDEAEPQWFDTSRLPYDDMWSVDRFWIPIMLDKKCVEGKVYYDDNGEVLLSHEIRASGLPV